MDRDRVFFIESSCLRQVVRFTFLILLLWTMVFYTAQSHAQTPPITNFCYNGKNVGHRLNSTVYKNLRALSKMDCVVYCVNEPCCRSANYRKRHCSDEKENCELLHGVTTEEPDNLEEDDDYDNFVLLQPKKSFDCQCFNKTCAGKQCTSAGSALPYDTIGCFRDTRDRAIAPLEGRDPILDGRYNARQNAIEKCYQAAKKRGFQMFAVQGGGWCASSATAVTTFDKYGLSTNCLPDGEGGGWANQVYYIKDYISVGCFKDASERAIQTLEGLDITLDGPYQSRENAIPKCAVAARRKGYSMFAVQDGGQCFASASAPMVFNKYGKSDACQSDGEGGAMVNEVYCIKG